jgi:hypothetical protein
LSKPSKKRRQAALAASGTAAMLLLSQASQATTVVATIIGAYDAQCGSCSLVNGTTIKNYQSNGGTSYDTPSLYILNPTGSSFTNVKITLTGYQDVAGGAASGASFTPGASLPAVQTITLPNIGANTVYQLDWNGYGGGGVTVGASTGLNLFAYDYDDSLYQQAPTGATDSTGHSCGTGSGTYPYAYCSFVGNFDTYFSADLKGAPISANFSPDNTQGGGNVAGTFVGWQGLDADGLSETVYDAHTKTFPGTLANIVTGTKGTQGGGTGVPEPGTLTLVGAALGAIGFARRRRKAADKQ